MLLQRYFDVSQSADVASLEANLVKFAHEMDFPIISCVLVIDRPGLTTPPTFVTVGNTPEAYQVDYNDREDMKRDPVGKRLKTMSVPFVYDQDLYVSEGAGDLFERQAAFGYRTGVCVALHLPDHKHFLLGVDRDTALPKRPERLTRLMADLQLLAVHAQSAAVTLLTPAEEPSLDPKLSPRELEVLRWTMEGKSAWAVGEILGVTEHAVNFHLRNVFRKLGVSSKHSAVLKALKLGLI
jgi:DNA-binding CsgD family transcriptional regulator